MEYGGFEKSVLDLLLKSVKIIALRRFVTKLLTLQFSMEIPISGVKFFSFSDPKVPRIFTGFCDPWYSATVEAGGLIFGIRSQRHDYII